MPTEDTEKVPNIDPASPEATLYPKLQPVTTLFPVFSVACSSDASLPIQFCERSVDCSKYAVYAVYMESALSHGD